MELTEPWKNIVINYSHLVISSCFDMWKQLIKTLKNYKSLTIDENIILENSFVIFYEFLILLLHLTDRSIVKLLKDKERNIFMNALIQKTDSDLIRSSFNTNINKDLYWMELYNLRQKEYSKYRIGTKKGNPQRGDIFWEFGKQIANLLNHPLSPEIVTSAYLIAADTFFSIILK